MCDLASGVPAVHLYRNENAKKLPARKNFFRGFGEKESAALFGRRVGVTVTLRRTLHGRGRTLRGSCEWLA